MNLLLLTICAMLSSILFLYMIHKHYIELNDNSKKGNVSYFIIEVLSLLLLSMVFWQFFYILSILESVFVMIYFIIVTILIGIILLIKTQIELPFQLIRKFKARNNFKSFSILGMWLSLSEFLLVPVTVYYFIQYGIFI